MAYREDDRARCESCESVLVLSEGVYAPDGRIVCRTCNSRALVAQSNAELAADGVRILRRSDRDVAQLSPVLGWVLIAPSALFGVGSLLAVLEHAWSGGSCSELGCMGIALLALGGLIFGSLPALIGVVLLPPRSRLRGAAVALAALVACVVSLSYP